MKKIVSLLLTLMLAVGLLTGCTDPKELYDNEDAIAGGSSAFEALNWAESSLTDDGTIDYTAGATSMVGAKLAFSFTINVKSATALLPAQLLAVLSRKNRLGAPSTLPMRYGVSSRSSIFPVLPLPRFLPLRKPQSSLVRLLTRTEF